MGNKSSNQNQGVSNNKTNNKMNNSPDKIKGISKVEDITKMDLNIEFNGAKGWPMDANVVFYHKPKV